ncbi:hypothetical protein RJT34_16979 [Clitoria ternatea]|uniref:Elongation factor EFG domain-containing protein n=1 Tax=Clitoria ternatea TaxID=43366 RepID=A0AAN9PDC0_CLITE
MASGKDYFAYEIGVLSPNQLQVEELYAGEVGYLSALIKIVADARVGDTVTSYGRRANNSLPGYEEATLMVFCGLFPVDADHFEPETSSAIGFGFRCGFLGLLHMEIVQVECSNPSLLPESRKRKSIEEPIVKIEMLTPKDYIGSLMELTQERRGLFKEMKFITKDRASIIYELPLAEVISSCN